jgi:transposase
MKKRYTPKQKAQIVLEILKEERSIAQIASEYGVHPNQLYKWKAQAVENLPGLFEDDRKSEKSLKAEADHAVGLAQKKIWHRTSCGVSGWRCSNGNQLNCRS